MSKYFLDSGYLDMDAIMTDPRPFVFVLGARGIGKTYGATKWCLENCDAGHKFIYMRRTAEEEKLINAGNIYSVHTDGVEINRHANPVQVEYDGQVVGYHIALSTIHNIRGFNMADVAYIIFDEFIAERGTVIRKFAGESMLNAYETINRNRELEGERPVKCVFLSNFNTAESDIMNAFGFTDEVYRYNNSYPLGIYSDDVKLLIMVNSNRISEQKARTVLYKATSDTDYKNMALENNGFVEIMPIKHYGRKSYDYLGTLGNVNINRLYSGYYYLTEAAELQPIDKKDVLHYLGVYHSYLLGNVYAASQYAAQQFLNNYE